MSEIFHAQNLQEFWSALQAFVLAEVVSLSTLGQLLAVAATLPFALWFGRYADKVLAQIGERFRTGTLTNRAIGILRPLSVHIAGMFLLWLCLLAAEKAQLPHHLIKICASLASAWVIIRLSSVLIGNQALGKLIAVCAWTVAALSILNLLQPTIEIMDGIGMSFGDHRISVLIVLKGVLSLALLLWAALMLSSLLEKRISGVPALTPSVRVLFSKLAKIVLITLACVISLNTMGVDLTAFAVFSGAVGVGIGFGLQKVVSNLISGVILLLDKSIKPGDVVAVSGTYGWIQSLGARYVSVVTRDGIEHLIPNEELITTRVENWSYSDRFVRLKIPIGISYNDDPRKAIALCKEAAAELPRIVDDPKPNCLLIGFGDNAINLEARVWIGDPANGVRNISSEYLLKVWDKFKEAGISIPYPQRDIHIRSMDPQAAKALRNIAENTDAS